VGRKGSRPSVPCHHIREYRYAYGAVEPQSGGSIFLVLPYCNTVCMNLFLRELSAAYPDDYIVLVADGAAWHMSKGLANIEIIPLPPYTPEMNPIEQIWAWLRLHGFRNEVFQTLEKVVDKLCETIRTLSCETIHNITFSNWILYTA
jgi:putative transposase